MTTLTTKQSILCINGDLKQDQQGKTNLSQSNERDYTNLTDLNCNRVIDLNGHHSTRDGIHQQVDFVKQGKLNSSFSVVADQTVENERSQASGNCQVPAQPTDITSVASSNTGSSECVLQRWSEAALSGERDQTQGEMESKYLNTATMLTSSTQVATFTSRDVNRQPQSGVRMSHAHPQKGLYRNDMANFMKETLEAVSEGLSTGLEPQLTNEGTSGTYILRGKNASPVAVFKPVDEEAFAPNNPRDMKAPFGSDTCRSGVKSGESTLRETVAFLLDHEGFAGVPATALVDLKHESMTPLSLEQSKAASENVYVPQASEGKVGSLQEFVKSEGPIEDFCSDLFSTEEVHKIGILDLRLMNLDRNTCNILVQKTVNPETFQENHRLVPIDHGMTLPDSLDVCSFDLVWLSFDQADQPFSATTQEYIAKLDIDADVKYLDTSFDIRPICLKNMKISGSLLKKAALKGLSLSQIGQILCRPDDDETQISPLETIVEKADLVADMMAYKNQSQLFSQSFYVEFIDKDTTLESETDSDQENEHQFLQPSKNFSQQKHWSSNCSFGTAASDGSDSSDEDNFTANLEQLFDGEHLQATATLLREQRTIQEQQNLDNEQGGVRVSPYDSEFFAAFDLLLNEALDSFIKTQQ